jgi:hypothetical protein
MVIKKKALGQCFYQHVVNSSCLSIRAEKFQGLVVLLPAFLFKGKHFRDGRSPRIIPCIRSRRDNYLGPCFMIIRKNIIPLALLILSLAAIVIAYMAGHSSIEYLFNSDELYLPTVFSDLLAKGGHMADWFLTPAPYFFPDYPIYWLAYLLGSTPYSQIAIFAVIQGVMVFLSLWLLSRTVSKSNALILAISVSITLIWLALIAGKPFSFLLSSASHYGIFITATLFTTLWLKHDDIHAKSRHIWLVLASAIAFASCLSDNLFLIQVTAPFVATALLIDIANRDFSIKRKIVLLVPAFFSVLGSFCYQFVVTHYTRYPAHLGFGKIFANLHDIYIIFNTAITATLAYSVLFLVYLGLMVHVAWDLFKRPAARTYPQALSWLTVFSLMSLCAIIAAVTLLTDLEVVERYFIAALSWPVIIVGLFAGHYLKTRLFLPATLLCTAAVISMGWSTYQLASQNGLSKHHYPASVACIDDVLEQAGLNNGIGQYWDAKYLQTFSRLQLNIAPHHGDLGEMPWITSKRYFKDRYDFAIISHDAEPQFTLSADELRRLNGEPRQIANCGSRSVYLYGKDNLHVKKFFGAGSTVQWQACELPTLIGRKADGCALEKNDPAQAGFLSYGPYEQLPPGKYSFEMTYQSPEAAEQVIGGWDIVLDQPQVSKTEAKGDINGSNGNVGTFSATFTVGETLDTQKVQIRTHVYAGKMLKITNLRVTRLE